MRRDEQKRRSHLDTEKYENSRVPGLRSKDNTQANCSDQVRTLLEKVKELQWLSPIQADAQLSRKVT
jgi:hypothetical protein